MARLSRILGRITVRLSILALLLWGGWWALMDPDSPLPPGWNPLEPLDVAAPETWLTGMKLRKALGSDATCLAALDTGAAYSRMEPLEAGACSVGNRVMLSSVGGAAIDPVETSCAIALRSAMWERHALRDAAADLGAPVARILHQGSYNCRPIRGSSARLSTHATAEAWDVRGVVLADGRQLSLLDGWDGSGAEAAFWRAARDGACTWFATVLGPDYNDLHADHFHLQSRGWGLCR
ncbi:extensin family protein [Jannaschia pohangensis]|uniref:Extensin-like protein C-terminus n=1 Tax=Jannaschia pohangensis TaxID=390807 RepID=A0A1I3U2P3_9RHOB|nr:extensin family protein [Jannaschia pohangensis]SFJ76041.1 Extensin-like protein C-terminus [Jannaschia pohangensis]